MKKRFAVFLTAIMCLFLLSACGSGKNDESKGVRTSRVTKNSVGAIKAESTNVVKMYGGDLTLPTDYRYAVSEGEDLTTYFVFNPNKCNDIADAKDGRSDGEYEALLKESWEKAKEEALKKAKGKEENLENEELQGEFVFDTDAYITPYHENTMMIIYEGIDRTTPKSDLTNTQVNKSFQSYLSTSILTNMKARNTKKFFGVPYPTKDVNVDKVPEYTKWLYDDKLNGEYYCYVAVTYSGDAMSTTYGEMAYPHTYYAVFLMEKEVFDGSFRRWYAFVFCNDSVGDTFSEADYNDVMNQIKKTFNITVFPTQQYNEEAKNYNKESDMRKGASYEQLNAMFNMTKQFYTMYNNQSVNIDELTDEEVQKDDSITEVTFD